MKATLLVLTLLITSFNFLYSDAGGYAFGAGGTVVPILNKAIIMEDEKININVKRISRAAFDVTYDCDFYFKNIKNTNQKLLMGFPIKMGTGFSSAGVKTTWYVNDIKDFSVTVDSNKTFYETFAQGINPELKEIPQYDLVYVFPIDFNSLENKNVRIRYKIFLTDDHGDYHIKYIIKSALTWEAPIKKAKINIHFDFPVRIRKGTPDDYTFKDYPYNSIQYNYENLKPTSDIDIQFYPVYVFPKNTFLLLNTVIYYSSGQYSYDKRPDLYIDYDFLYDKFIKDFTSEQIKMLQYSILAYHGYIGEGEIKEYLEKNFYNNKNNSEVFKRNPYFKIEMLSDIEKKLFKHFGGNVLEKNPYNYTDEINTLCEEYFNDSSSYLLFKLKTIIDDLKLSGHKRKIIYNNIDFNILRKANYIIGDYISQFDYKIRGYNFHSASYFYNAFINCQYCKKNNVKDFTNLLPSDLEKWETEDTYPCYEIAFKICCLYILKGKYYMNSIREYAKINAVTEFYRAYRWLAISVYLNKDNKKIYKQNSIGILLEIDSKMYNNIFNKIWSFSGDDTNLKNTITKYAISKRYFITKISNLRLRNMPHLRSNVKRLLKKGEKLELLSLGEYEVIDGIKNGRWVWCKTEQGDEGWCYSGYLEEVEQ